MGGVVVLKSVSGLNRPDQYAGVEKCTLQRQKLCNQR